MKRLLIKVAATALVFSGAAAEDFGSVKSRAEQGDADAQFALAELLYQGKGTPTDVAESAKWRLRAAEQGHEKAQMWLGIIYDYGIGVPKDDAEAMKWFLRAAEQGHAPSQFQVGFNYYHGKMVPQDFVEAHKWFNLAGADGHQAARKAREEVANRMTPEQIAEAQNLARDWRPKMK